MTTTKSAGGLPELPEPCILFDHDGNEVECFAAGQMRAYGELCCTTAARSMDAKDDGAVERVSRILCREDGINPDHVTVTEYNGVDREEPAWLMHSDVARLVIAALAAQSAGGGGAVAAYSGDLAGHKVMPGFITPELTAALQNAIGHPAPSDAERLREVETMAERIVAKYGRELGWGCMNDKAKMDKARALVLAATGSQGGEAN